MGSTKKRRFLLPVSVIMAAAMLAGCSQGSGDDSSNGGSDDAKRGGILQIAGGADIGAFDPAVVRSTGTFVHRAVTRQLFLMPTTSDESARVPIADLATEVPVPTNDGTTYEITLREGAMWNSAPARQIVAADAIRGIKRLCNPVRPSGESGYYVNTIEGLDTFCAGFADVTPDAKSIKDYVENTDVSGLKETGELSFTLTLVQPTADFIYVLSQIAAAPIAIEMMDYLPDSPEFRNNYVASGPYTITGYKADQSMTIGRNPSWTQESDPYRKAYIDGIEISMTNADAGRVQRLIEAGEADMYFDQSVPTADLQRLMLKKDPNLLQINDSGVNPVFLLNLQSPDNNSALADVKVRQAINYAMNKKAVVQVGGGPDVKFPHHQILTSAINGFESYDLYATKDSAGDPAKAKKMLAEAGYPDGITLDFVYATGGRYDAYAQALEPGLREAGIKLNLIPTPSANLLGQYLQNKEATNSGTWDVALRSINPAWIGNGARTMIVPMFEGTDCKLSTTNYACYNNPAVNELIADAQKEQDAAKAAALWAEIDRTIMADAPIVPLISGKVTLYRSERLQDAVINVGFYSVDPGLVWLKK